jgi:hypothetical protein
MRLFGKVAVVAILCSIAVSTSWSGIPATYTGKVFTGDTLKGHPQQIPGVVKAVFFDEGGEGIGYHDGSSGNTGGTMRPLAADINVDMQPFNGLDLYLDGSAPTKESWHLSWIDQGDWFRCIVHVNSAGTYNVGTYQAVASTPNTQTLTIDEGTPVTISNLATTPSGNHEIWHNWKTFNNVASVKLDTGLHVVKWTFVTASFNFDKILFSKSTDVQPSTASVTTRQSFAPRVASERNAVAVSFKLPEAGRTALSIVDCKGRTVASAPERFLAAGIQKQTLSTATLCPGIYFVKIRQNGSSIESRFAVTQ